MKFCDAYIFQLVSVFQVNDLIKVPIASPLFGYYLNLEPFSKLL